MARLYSYCFSNVSVFAISLSFARSLGIHWRPLMLGLGLSFPLISMPGIWTLEHAGIPRPNQASIKSSALTACPCCLTRYHLHVCLSRRQIAVVNFMRYFEWFFFFFAMNTSMRNIGLDFSCIIVGAFSLPCRHSFGSSCNPPQLSWGRNVCVGG